MGYVCERNADEEAESASEEKISDWKDLLWGLGEEGGEENYVGEIRGALWCRRSSTSILEVLLCINFPLLFSSSHDVFLHPPHRMARQRLRPGHPSSCPLPPRRAERAPSPTALGPLAVASEEE